MIYNNEFLTLTILSSQNLQHERPNVSISARSVVYPTSCHAVYCCNSIVINTVTQMQVDVQLYKKKVEAPEESRPQSPVRSSIWRVESPNRRGIWSPAVTCEEENQRLKDVSHSSSSPPSSSSSCLCHAQDGKEAAENAGCFKSQGKPDKTFPVRLFR